MSTGLVCKVKPCGGTIMSEFDGIENTGVKAMRDTIDRKNEEIAKLQGELHQHKDAKLSTVVKQIGLNPDNGLGKALKQVYDGEATAEAVAEFAKTEYSYEPTVGLQEVTQTELPPVVQDDARARVATLDDYSQSDVPRDVLNDLQEIISKGTPKDSIRARLTLMEDEKNK